MYRSQRRLVGEQSVGPKALSPSQAEAILIAEKRFVEVLDSVGFCGRVISYFDEMLGIKKTKVVVVLESQQGLLSRERFFSIQDWHKQTEGGRQLM